MTKGTTLPGFIVLTILRFAKKHDCATRRLLAGLPRDLEAAMRRGECAAWDDVAVLFTRLDSLARDVPSRFADFYVEDCPIPAMVGTYLVSPAELYRAAFHGWTHGWPMLNFQSRETSKGWIVKARIEPPLRECEAFFRILTEILRRLPRVLSCADAIVEPELSRRSARWSVRVAEKQPLAKEPSPDDVFSAVRAQVFSAEVAGARVPPAWGLTPTEERVVRSIAAGLSIRETAADLGVKTETARTHLKRAMSKAGVHRQVELVRQLIGSAS
ncbi:MAG: hypothetical protein KF819_16380 [Labilithrix sp.]|nr:hypothetical protein [Labilithrix sp.]